ncbi:MAG: gliding motility-associated C-terminal domain-containing protein [Bacteroidota bacterium]
MKKIIVLLMLLVPGSLAATSTSGATNRGLNIDGVVIDGATAGSNTTLWETDEVFQGFMGIINWYMTWDDNNLYLGKIGGNNAEGAVIYLRAEYPGATQTNTGFLYDGLNPGLAPMGGVNFAAYFRDTYDEFRTWSNGAWSAPTTTLAPFFSNQANGDNLEVTIPWNAITNGNGIPSNIRVVLYQVVPPGVNVNCNGEEFVYAESPWGTGNPGDGPSIGVNDGQPTSAVQPGGCSRGDSTATRWWGCYPVIGGVGSNGWIAVQPEAGPDSIICPQATAYAMQGNQPPVVSLGTWSVVGQPPGSPPVNIVDPNNPNTLMQNLTGFGDYTFIWDINYGGCPSAPDTVVISRWADPPPATVGPDQQLPCDLDSAFVFGNDPGPQMNGLGGVGQWVLVSGQGSISTPNDTATWITALGYGDNVFAWQITNGPCMMTSAQVTLTRYAPVSIDAGPDQDICGVSIASLAGNDPINIQATAQGNWSQISGPSQAMFTNPLFFNSNVSGLVPGTYQFVWSIANGTCPAREDTVRVRVFDRPQVDAGGDQFICAGDDAVLDGNNPLAIAPTAMGTWNQLSGPSVAVFGDTNLFNTPVSGLEVGQYVLTWTMRNGPCPEEVDQMTVFVSQVVNDGLASATAADRDSANGGMVVNIPLSGTPPYRYGLSLNDFQSSATFNNLAPGTYALYIVDDLGCLDSLTFEIEAIIPPPPSRDTVVVTTGFSPNGDATNDTWELPGIELFPQATVEIYNIWGGLVYRTEGNYLPWNGQRNGKDLPTGTYYFIIDLNAPDQDPIKGNLTLLR